MDTRKFETGATRNSEDGKLDFEGFFSPLVIERMAEYMHSHRKLADGTMRASDNWQLGIPKDVYIKSAWRHFFDWWKAHRGIKTARPAEDIETTLCGLLFNAMGYLHELRKQAKEDYQNSAQVEGDQLAPPSIEIGAKQHKAPSDYDAAVSQAAQAVTRANEPEHNRGRYLSL